MRAVRTRPLVPIVGSARSFAKVSLIDYRETHLRRPGPSPMDQGTSCPRHLHCTRCTRSAEGWSAQFH